MYPLLAYFRYKDSGKLKIATTTSTSNTPSTNETLLILCRYLEIYVEQTKLPKIEIVNRVRKSLRPMNPKRLPWITFKSELEKMVNAQVAAAWIPLQPRDLYMGMRKRPPPSPMPLKSPAMQLILVTKEILSSTTLLEVDVT